ncbi:MAG: hypothetical protein JWM95_2480, partial [Gemmatimonadetes bacterium]|nr:hypothetical protein [Gemmatimonadota bacterium]
SRISDLSTYGRAMLVFRIASGIVIGPVSALALAIAGPFRWIRLDELGSLTSSAVPAFYLLGHTLLAMVLLVVAMRWRSSEILAGGTRNDATRLLVGAVAMLPYAYLLSFTHYPPTASIGMDMSVHLAASVPIAVIIGCGAGWLLERRRVLFRAIVLAYGLGMLATLIRVQQGFAREWDLERSVYRQLLVHVPDLDAHTRVVLDVRDSLAARPEVPKWGYPESIALMVQAGAATGDGPRFIRPPDPRPDSAGPWYHRFEPAAYARLKSAKYLRRSQGEFSEPRLRVGADGRREWRPDVDLPVWESFDDKRLVHLVLQRGRVTRVNEPIMLDGISMPVSAPGPAYLRLSRLGEVIAGSASPR